MSNLNNNYLKEYSKLSVSKYDFAKEFINRIKELKQKSKVLDAGIGTGGITSFLHSINSSCRYFGVDIRDSSQFLPDYVSFKKASLDKIPFENNFFDMVVCNQVLEHVSDPFTVMQEIKRVLKVGGIAYVTVPSNRSILVPFSRNFYSDYTHINPFSKLGLIRLVQDAGFSILSINYLRNYKTIFIAPYLILKSLFLLKSEPFSQLLSQVFGGTIYATFKK